jgi:hypothetical protein
MDFSYFKPDFTPRQMFEKGVLGGWYHRPIYSSVLKKNIKPDYSKFDFLNGIPKNKLENTVYDKTLNYYKVKAGQSLEFWEEKGWIQPIDPRGWIQWYCNFHNGRRSYDDKRQINRALRILLRFGQRKMTPAIKQTLLHWGWNPEKDHTEYIKLIKLNGWARN